MRGRRRLPVERFDAAGGRWREVHAPAPVECDELTLATFNMWFDEHFADHRYRAMAALLCDAMPDVMVFQEVTAPALEVFLTQSWVREHYLASSITGDGVGNYGMLLLTRLPVDGVTYTRLPTRLDRGYLRADLTVNGAAVAVCCVHLDSGKRSARLRARQLRSLFRAVRGVDEAVLLGDFNMRDTENGRITAPFTDVWPALRPGEDGFTEDTSINLMRFDSKNKHRHVRFDRVLVKGRRWEPVGIDLLGTRPVSAALPRVFPSDHFGVVCRLAHRAAAQAPRPPWWRRAGSRVG
ncbi:endonuclease/exonuclease/phosphatase family protein [Mycobacterium sp. NPDC050551]|uniref:endonuclease/exonuclease/phosphatase family protein n=1 Tax=Mycobacterium sp. NPDC050551 TaxID=3155407 RepID=UPI00343BD03F